MTFFGLNLILSAASAKSISVRVKTDTGSCTLLTVCTHSSSVVQSHLCPMQEVCVDIKCDKHGSHANTIMHTVTAPSIAEYLLCS